MEEYQKSRNLCWKLAKIIIILKVITVANIITMLLLNRFLLRKLWHIKWVRAAYNLLQFITNTVPSWATYLLIALFMITFAGYLQKKRSVIDENMALDELQKSRKHAKTALLICGVLLALRIAAALRIAFLITTDVDKFTAYVIFPVNNILTTLQPVLMACVCAALAQQLYWQRQVCVISLPPSHDKKFIVNGLALAVICNFILGRVIIARNDRMWEAIFKASDSTARAAIKSQQQPTINMCIFCNNLLYILIMVLFVWLTVRVISEQTPSDTQYISSHKNPVKPWALAVWGCWGVFCLLKMILLVMQITLETNIKPLLPWQMVISQLFSLAAPILLLWYVIGEIRRKQ